MDAKYYTTCNGQTVSLTNVGFGKLGDRGLMNPPEKCEKVLTYRDATKRVYDYLMGKCACGQYHFVERRIERPALASNHRCDGRCMSSKGRKCECSCGGKNHGIN